MGTAPPTGDIILKSSSADFPEISAMIARCLLEVNVNDYPEHVIDALVEHHHLENLANILDGNFSIVVKRDGKVIGSGVLAGTEIRTVFVLPEMHGKGVGSQIMHALEAEACRQKLKQVDLHSSLTAVSFYEKLGYRQVETVEREIGGEAIVMVKDLCRDLS